MTDEHRPICTRCGAASPDTNTNYTLISSTGWRLAREKSPTGLIVAWHCPACWSKHKAKLGAGAK
jgi:hypothetical protein